MILPTPTPDALRAKRSSAGLTQSQAAGELKMDYSAVDFDGVTYWIR